MTTPSFVDETSVSAYSVASTFNVAVPLVTDGDFMLISIIESGPATGALEMLPAGWTPFFPTLVDSSNGSIGCVVRWGWRIAASEPANYAAHTSGVNGDMYASIVAWRGADRSSPIDYADWTRAAANPIRGNSITGSGADDFLVWSAGVYSVPSGATATPAGMTGRLFGSSAQGVQTTVADQAWAGNAGVATGVRDGSDGSNRFGVVLMALVKAASEPIVGALGTV